MRAVTTDVDTRTRAWNMAMAVSPGPLDLTIAADAITGVVPGALRGGRLLSNGPGWTRIGGRTARPEAGHVLALLSEPLAGRTTLAVFDALALEDGPVARVPLPLLPVAFHGAWDP